MGATRNSLQKIVKDEKMKTEIVGHLCEVSWKTNFVLKGYVVDADDRGFTFKTKQKTTWISFDQISDITVIE